MIYFHAVMLDECGMEFGVGISAKTKDDAREALAEAFPENRGIVQIESTEDAAKRERAMYDRISREMDCDFFDAEGEW